MKISEVTELDRDQQEIPVPQMEFVYHGSLGPDPDNEDFNPEAFQKLLNGVVDLSAAEGGYFGFGFYVTENEALARSNYASRGGYVFKYRLNPRRILDLRVAGHFDKWQRSGLARMISDRRMPQIAISKGIAGVYDRSMGGMCIYDPRVLTFVGYEGPKNVNI